MNKETFKLCEFVGNDKLSRYCVLDELIAPAVVALNKKGYMTIDSCASHFMNHNVCAITVDCEDKSDENVKFITDTITSEYSGHRDFYLKHDECDDKFVLYVNRERFEHVALISIKGIHNFKDLPSPWCVDYPDDEDVTVLRCPIFVFSEDTDDDEYASRYYDYQIAVIGRMRQLMEYIGNLPHIE